MITTHLSKILKQEPEVEFEIPKKIFLKYSAGMGLKDNLIGSFWDM